MTYVTDGLGEMASPSQPLPPHPLSSHIGPAVHHGGVTRGTFFKKRKAVRGGVPFPIGPHTLVTVGGTDEVAYGISADYQAFTANPVCSLNPLLSDGKPPE